MCTKFDYHFGESFNALGFVCLKTNWSFFGEKKATCDTATSSAQTWGCQTKQRHASLQNCLDLSLRIILPWKLNMKPQNAPLEAGKIMYFPNHHFSGAMLLIFRAGFMCLSMGKIHHFSATRLGELFGGKNFSHWLQRGQATLGVCQVL